MNKVSIDEITKRVKVQNFPLNRICKIKHYLPINVKIDFFKEYKELTENNIDEIPEEIIVMYGFICFHLLLIKYYTNINTNITFDDYDKLMESGIISELVREINSEYLFLKNMINLTVRMDDE